MAAKPKKAEEKPRAARGTERLAVFLKPEQIAWLKTKGDNVSETLRAVITEAMNMDRLAESVRKGAKKKSSK